MEPIIMKQQKQTKKQSLKKILFGSVVFVGLSVGPVQHSYAHTQQQRYTLTIKHASLKIPRRQQNNLVGYMRRF